MPAHVTAVRGPLIWFRDDPFLVGRDDAFVYESDGLLICEGGVITAAGDYGALRERLPRGTTVDHYPDHVITAGFIDSHIHYVQTGIIAAFGSQLIDWLNHYTFVEEQRFSDADYARRIASFFCDELLRNGTTTALTFCAVYPQSVDALFEESSRRGMRMAAGKVLMDRNAPTPCSTPLSRATRTPRRCWNVGTARTATSTPSRPASPRRARRRSWRRPARCGASTPKRWCTRTSPRTPERSPGYDPSSLTGGATSTSTTTSGSSGAAPCWPTECT